MSLRILAGSHKGRPITVPGGATELRPTSARRRAAVFDILRAHVGDFEGLRFADLFAGSGAVGLEALSQGFDETVFVENEPRAAAVLQQNVDALGLTRRARLLRNDATRLAAAPAPFDVTFLDPPYGLGFAERCLRRLRDGAWLADESVVLIELGRDDRLEVPTGLSAAREHTHGAGRLVRLAVAD